MSLFVLIVIAGHAIPPIIGGITGKSKKSVIIGALIACMIAILSGSPAFIMADLIGVGIGTWMGFLVIDDKTSKVE